MRLLPAVAAARYKRYVVRRGSRALCSYGRCCVLVAASLGSTGCVSVGQALSYEAVKPWEKGALADPGMQLVSDRLERSADEHIFFSREASTGGASIKGGGCGCN